MPTQQFYQFCAWSLAVILFSTIPTCSQQASSWSEPVSALSALSPHQQQILQELMKADIVYLGETHDRIEDHQAQLQILQALHRHNPKIAIGMEMFQRPYQEILDRYIAGELTEAELIEQTEYERRWGFPWELYAPILRFAKQHQIPVIALNTPSEVTRKVARGGLDSLTPSDWQYIPPLAEIRTDNAQYRQMVLEAFEQHQTAGHGSSTSLERFFTAQVLWDETMAEAIAQFLQVKPDYQVVALAGQGHIVYGYGIPNRVSRRMQQNHPARQFIQRSVLLSPPADAPSGIADFFWEK